jgi:hypothetical protein
VPRARPRAPPKSPINNANTNIRQNQIIGSSLSFSDNNSSKTNRRRASLLFVGGSECCPAISTIINYGRRVFVEAMIVGLFE